MNNLIQDIENLANGTNVAVAGKYLCSVEELKDIARRVKRFNKAGTKACSCYGDHNGFLTDPDCVVHGD